MKIAAVVILYNPDEDVFRNIETYSGLVEKLIIIDNTEKKQDWVYRKASNFSNSVYLHDGENSGIAKRLNEAAKLASGENYDLLLTMDQDSAFSQKDLLFYFSCIGNSNDFSQTAMFGVNYISKVTDNQNCEAVSVEQLITSGSVLNLKIFSETEGFDENLFIDEVDLDFCYHAITKGFKIIQYTNIYLHHNLGTASFHRSIATFKISKRILHSPIRIYYMVRNFLYVNQKYPARFTEDKSRRRSALFNRLKNNILYSNNRATVVKAIYSGYIDFKNSRLGKQKID